MTNAWSQTPLRAPSRDEDLRVWANQVCARINALMGIDYDTSEPLASEHVARRDNPHMVTAYQSGADVAGTAQTLVNIETNARTASMAAEVSARVAADTAEADARSTGDVAEATARIAADVAEADARALADTNERNERIIADATHASDLSTHGVTEIVGAVETQTLTNKTVPDLQFALTGPTRTPAEGMIYWDTTEKTLAAKLEGSGTVLQIGQETHVRCTNKTGSDIPNGSVVYVSGAFSQRPTVALAKADADATGRAVGVTTQEIKKNNTGYVTIDGLVHDLNTAAFTAGDVLYLSSSSAGGMQNTAPAFPNYCIEVGVVLYADATAGEVLVHPKIEPTNHVMLNHLGAKDAYLGDIGGGNYTQIESDGTIVNVGNATTYDDSQSGVYYLRSGGTALTQDIFSGGIYQYRFDKTDEIYTQIQLSHKYKVNSPVHLHIHLANKAAVGATSYNVGIQVEYMWGSINSVFPAAVTASTVDCSFQNASALTHKVFELGAITPTTNQGSISSVLIMRVARVAGTTQDLAGNNIFIMGIDVHTQMDTLGSRQEYIK